jgi:hypothetical protein
VVYRACYSVTLAAFISFLNPVRRDCALLSKLRHTKKIQEGIVFDVA